MDRDLLETPVVHQLVKKFPTFTESEFSFAFDISLPFDPALSHMIQASQGFPLRSPTYAWNFPTVPDKNNNPNKSFITRN
jgi:hypothetical protein